MCFVSYVADDFRDRLPKEWPWVVPYTSPTITPSVGQSVPREEFDSLKKEVELLKKMLGLAKGYDEKNKEPDCETESKFELLRKIGQLVGVDLDEVLRKKSEPAVILTTGSVTANNNMIKTTTDAGPAKQ